MSRMFLRSVGVGFVLAVAVPLTCANTMVFDRGLPTSNLNNTAGAARSNVAWADWEATDQPTEYWLPGDDFTLSGTGNNYVTKIRLWTADGISGQQSLTLWGGLDGSTIAPVSSIYSVMPVTYANSDGYQGSSGNFIQLYQIDFDVGFNLAGGQKYDFFLQAPWHPYQSGGYVNGFLHASNKDLSGSTQEEADDVFLWLHHTDLGDVVETWNSGDGSGTSGFPKGWDKSSDANVQVFVPDASDTATLAGVAFAGLMLFRRRLAD